MKKWFILIALVSGAAATASAQTTDTPAVRSGNTDTFVAPAQPTPPPTPRATPLPEEIYGGRPVGVFPRAIRGGNPAQMLNPKAPAQYGQAHDNVTHDPNEPGKPKGIKFFEWLW